jgi:succinate dehydrogenase hydrophobic anchor subunit
MEAQKKSKRKVAFILILAALAGVALFGWFVHLVLLAAHVSEPATNTVYGITSKRLWASIIALLALVGVIFGWLALRKSEGRIGIRKGKRRAIVAVVAGLIAVATGGLNLALATGGPGSGNGVVAGAAAIVLGLIAIVFGGLALMRSTRIDKDSSNRDTA